MPGSNNNATVVESSGRTYQMMSLPDFRRFRDKITSDDPAWTTHYQDSKLTVQSMPPGDNSTSLNIIRATYIMANVPPRVLYDQLHDAQYRATWDNNMIEGYNITKFNAHNDIGYYSAKFPWPLKNRDFCNMRSWMEFTNGEYIIFNHSEPHNDCPEKPDFIRGISFLTGYYIQPHDKGTRLSYITHSDPKGSIPTAIINFAMKKGAPGLLGTCEKKSERYPEFVAKTYPPGTVFSWTTPKMDWDSTDIYPSDAVEAAQKETLKTDDVETAREKRKHKAAPRPRKPRTKTVVESSGRTYQMMSLPDFRRFRDKITSDDPAWTTHYQDSKLTVQSMPPGDNSTSLNIIRATYIMANVPPRVLYDQLHDAQYRATWDNNMIEGYNITKFNAHNDIGYYSAKFPWPLKNRDFCNMRSWMEFTNGEYIIFNHSEPHNDCPEKPDFIRGISFLTGYYIQPHDKGTRLSYITHSDPKGSIPTAIINFAMKKGAPGLLGTCEKMSERYPEFVAKTYPPGTVFSWTTPKMDWDSTDIYPETEEALDEGEVVSDDEEDDDDKVQTLGGYGDALDGPSVSLAPVAQLKPNDSVSIQQYRTIMQDVMNTVDRSFLREGRAPTSREYVIRLKYAMDGIRKTMIA